MAETLYIHYFLLTVSLVICIDHLFLLQTPLAAPRPVLGVFLEEGKVRHTLFCRGHIFWHIIVSLLQVTPVIATPKNEDLHCGLLLHQLSMEHLAEGDIVTAICHLHSFLGAQLD